MYIVFKKIAFIEICCSSKCVVFEHKVHDVSRRLRRKPEILTLCHFVYIVFRKTAFIEIYCSSKCVVI